MRTAIVLIALAGCYEPSTDPGEMVIYQVSEIGDVSITGDLIRWKDGMTVREASLSSYPISNRETPAVGDTRAALVVHGDSIYLVDTNGVVQVTGTKETRVVTELGVTDLIVADDGAIYWAHSTGVSWYGTGGQVRGVSMDADGVVEMAVSQGEVYATTIGEYARGLGLATEGRLYQVDRSAVRGIQIATAGDFADDFIDDHFGAKDIFQSRGLHVIGDQLYWSVEDHTQSSEYDQTLVVQRTTTGFPIVLPPLHDTSPYWVSDGAFYWTTNDGRVMRAPPNGTPTQVTAGFVRAVTIKDGYLYGFVKSLSGPDFGYDLRRIPLYVPTE